MGGSSNWLKSLITFKKFHPVDHDKSGSKSKKRWKLWKSPSVKGSSGQSEPLDISSLTIMGGEGNAALNAAMAAVIRAPSKDFLLVRQNWAATRIQTAFRAFLARRAFRALKSLVKLQALVRGRLVRKQAAVTLRCMQALVRAQAHVKARRIRMSLEEQAALTSVKDHQTDPVKQAEEGWCDIRGSAEEVKSKLRMRQEGAIKRERAISYSAIHQQLRASPNLNPMKSKQFTSFQSPKLDKNSFGWSWLDRWMANKPWEGRLMEEIRSEIPFSSPLAKISSPKQNKLRVGCSTDSEHGSSSVRRNSSVVRILTKGNTSGHFTHSYSEPSSKHLLEETSTSTSSMSASRTPGSSTTDKTDESSSSKPRYMNVTASRAKQMENKLHSPSSIQRRPLRDIQNHSMSLTRTRFSGEARSSVDAIKRAVTVCEDLYPPLQVDRFGWKYR